MDDVVLNEKRLELAIEKLIQQLILDLNSIEEKNMIKSSNFKNMEECFNSLAKAEYHIVTALSWSNGFNSEKFSIKTNKLLDDIITALKKPK